jgi:hypothetical protein
VSGPDEFADFVRDAELLARLAEVLGCTEPSEADMSCYDIGSAGTVDADEVVRQIQRDWPDVDGEQ